MTCRTVLTRFKLELALLRESPETQSLRADVNEMQHMLEDYLAFAKGDGGEEAGRRTSASCSTRFMTRREHLRHADRAQAAPAQARARAAPETAGLQARDHQPRDQRGPLRRPRRHPRRGRGPVAAHRGRRRRPGHPGTERDNVFRPFYRLDHARNQDEGNTGLGLAIARDIASSHGGDIALGESSMGGLRATIRVPL